MIQFTFSLCLMHLKMNKLLLFFFSATIAVHFSVELDLNDILRNPQALEAAKIGILAYKNSNKSKNVKCAEQLDLFLENLQKCCSDNWAMQMIDASAELPSGIIAQQNLLGQYDKCLSIESVDATVKGQYCLISPTFNGAGSKGSFNNFEHPYAHKSIWNQLIRGNEDALSYSIPNLGICIPDKCTEEDVDLVLAKVLVTTPTTAKCQTDQTMPIDLGTLITIGYFGIFIMLMCISTIYDVLTKKARPHPLLLSFSIRTNCKKLFSTKKNPHHFRCLYGLKVISLIWVLAGHYVMTKLMLNPFFNSLETDQYDHTFESIIFINAINSADTFLVISGCLIAYNYMKLRHMGNWYSIGFYYTLKYIRLTFAIIPMLLCTIFLTKYISYGPLKPVIDRVLVEPCRKYWLSSLLFIGDPNNDEICLLQGWYLNVDFQLYQITALFLYLLWKSPKHGIRAIVVAIIGSLVMSFMDIWNSDIEKDGYLNIHTYLYYYTSIKTRAATWFLGCLLGYYLAEMKLRNQYISTLTSYKRSNKVSWLMVLIEIPAWICVGIYRLLSYEDGRLILALYNASASIAWGICVTWIIFACSNGIGGKLNKFLSLPIFQILSRFVLSAFIVHLNIMFIIAINPRHTIYFPAFNSLFFFLGSTLITLIVSLFWVLAFESPICRVEDYFLKDKKNIIDENNNTSPYA